jgi:uncharacterized protein
MSDQHFDYDLMVQDALKGVVRSIIEDVAKNGLKGDHHYYIAFRTTDPDVVLPDHIKARYTDEMTVVLQHRYWGLKVNDDNFEIGLSFNQKPEHLVIPFEAIIGFVDPSAQFALQFEYGEDKASNDTGLDDGQDIAIEAGAEAITINNPAKIEAGEATGDANIITLDSFRNKKS